ncbi:microtubule binding motor protein [Lithospermum erythrorhizon]|uniref:Microtubule binding motor protein n=1 Tax=Lithospermum erythrorhizon TaxID=34254 RepID=A0AAV3NJH1_LITER
MKLNSLQSASSRSLFSIVNNILEEGIERKNGDIPQPVSSLLKLIVEEIEQRVLKQAENLKKQSLLYKTREKRYQSRINALETLSTGTTEEHEVVMQQLQQIKIEKSRIDEERKLENQELNLLLKEKVDYEMHISSLKRELEFTIKTHEENFLQLKTLSTETKVELEKKIIELACNLVDSQKRVEELENLSESKYMRWKKKELGYKHFIDSHVGSIQDLRKDSECLKQEVLKIKRFYIEEFNNFELEVKGLVDAAQNYHVVLTENRKLYNEVQDLKGNIRVYCRVRPFHQGQRKKQTTIEYIGENGELVVANPLKQGKDTRRVFKFSKVFSPTATQEDVFGDTRPLIRSVLDGYNVCIFAYGQTGSGKTFTMTGPNLSSIEEWGVNYRALNDLFNISQNRKSSIKYDIGVQMVEIYNEQVRDVLISESSQKKYPFCRA